MDSQSHEKCRATLIGHISVFHLKIHLSSCLRFTIPTLLVNMTRGGDGWGDWSAKSIIRRTPWIAGSNDDIERLKSTLQADTKRHFKTQLRPLREHTVVNNDCHRLTDLLYVMSVLIH